MVNFSLVRFCHLGVCKVGQTEHWHKFFMWLMSRTRLETFTNFNFLSVFTFLLTSLATRQCTTSSELRAMPNEGCRVRMWLLVWGFESSTLGYVIIHFAWELPEAGFLHSHNLSLRLSVINGSVCSVDLTMRNPVLTIRAIDYSSIRFSISFFYPVYKVWNWSHYQSSNDGWRRNQESNMGHSRRDFKKDSHNLLVFVR